MRLSTKSLLILFAIGASCGLIGDHAAVASGAIVYLDTGGVPSIWGSPIFFPPMVGVGTMALAELRVRMGPVRAGTGSEALAAIASVLGLYLLTAILADETTSTATALIASLATLIYVRFGDGHRAIVCGTLAAVSGPLIEGVESQAGIFEYTANVDGLLGVAPWLVPLYFAFGVVSARLGELFFAHEQDNAL